MSKQSEIVRRWLEYQNSHPNFAVEAGTRRMNAPQAERAIEGGERHRSTRLPTRGIQAYAVTISTLAVVGSLLAIRYIANNRRVDTQDWDEWASYAESTGALSRDH